MRNLPFSDQFKVVVGLLGTVPSTTTPKRVKMTNADRVTILILADNATTVTGSAITLKQSKDAAGTDEKALSFSTALRNIDTAAAGGDVLAAFAVASDTFTTNAVNSKDILYQIEVRAQDLDVQNGFAWIRVGTGDATAAAITVLYILHLQQHPAATAPTQIA
jgi:hypothetical protein